MRAKFKLTVITTAEGGSRLRFEPVTSGSPENAEFFKWTPFGSIDIGTINPAILGEMEVGKEYYVDFTKAN